MVSMLLRVHLVVRQGKSLLFHQLIFTEEVSKIMKNSGILGLVVIAIICYAIMVVGIAAAIIGAVIGMAYLIRWIYKTISENKKRALNQQKFGDDLVALYAINESVDSPISKPNERLQWIIKQILDKYQISPRLNDSLTKFRDTFFDSIKQSSIWINESKVDYNTSTSSSLSRHDVKVVNSGFLLDQDAISSFALQSKGIKLVFYPQFIIAELNTEYKIIQYNEVKVKHLESIYIAEQSGKIIRGASPVYYNYLHERVNGGPDRRYKNNPSTPVYRHEIFTLILGTDIQFISAADGIARSLLNCIEKIKQLNVQYPPLPIRKINEIPVSTNEYASAIRDLIRLHGKSILLDKKFINSLKDYGFSKEYPYIFHVIDSLKSNKHLDSLIQDDCCYSMLETIKKSLLQTSNHSQDEIDTVLAFLGYGLQLTA